MTLVLSPSEIVSKLELIGELGLLGKAPEWDRRALGELVQVQNGAPFPSDRFNREGQGMPLIRIRDVGARETSTYFDGEFDLAYVVRGGDLLVGMDGDFRCAKWGGRDALLNQRVCRLVVTSNELDESFLFYILQGYLDAIWKETSATTVKHLSSKSIQEIPIPLPPLPEQHKIVEILEDHLSRLDAALADVKQAKVKAAQFRRSLLQAAFTGNLGSDGTRLMTSYPSNWQIESLDSLINRGIIKLNRGDIISKRDIAAHPGDYPIYSSAKENNGMFGRYGKFMFDEEVITWSIDGGGRLFYREKQKFSVTNVGGIMRILDRNVFDYKFLFYALTNLHSQVIFDWSRKAHPSVIRLVYDKIPIPPLPEQHKIVEILEDHLSRLDASVALADAMEKQSAGLRRSLLQAAFTGQLTKEVASV